MIRSFSRCALLASILVCLHGAANPPVTLEQVYPVTAPPGGKVTIVLSRPVPKAQVRFGAKDAKVESILGSILYVVVPAGLVPGEAPPITIETPQGDAFYLGFKVAPVSGEKRDVAGKRPAPSAPPPTTENRVLAELESLRDRVLQPSNFAVLVFALIIGVLAKALYNEWKRGRELTASIDHVRFINERAQEAALLTSEEALTPDDFQPGPPPVPDELVAICASGNCLLFAGPGLGAQSGLPTRYEAVARIIQSADLTPQLREQLTTAINAGQLSLATEVLAGKVPHDALVNALESLYYHSPDLSTAHKALSDISFAAAVTTNWDTMIDATFADRRPMVVASDEDVVGLSPRHSDFFIAKVSGDLTQQHSVVFSSAEMRETANERPNLAKFVAAEVLSRPVLFVGMSLSGIEEFFENFRFRLRTSLPTYALLPYAPFWDAQCERFAMRYGVRLIGYKPSPGHPEMAAFLADLSNRVKKVAPRRRREPRIPRLRKVRLTNIGVFTNLEIDFNDGWNVILGNNGSGKSTILRAIALALCGNDGAAMLAGQRLLRQGATSGKIELTVGDVTCDTTLRRDPRTNRVTVVGAPTPLQKRDWVVLGFPPLRGISLTNPPGPTAGGSPDPQVEDLIPVIAGGFDTRLDSVKQWLVNLEVNSSGSVPRDTADRNRRLRDSFFSLLTKLIPGQSVSYGHIDRVTWQAYVVTEDGEVPIDDVSQGMGSIFGWAGTLLQRLYEIHSEMANPAEAPALVLVDEIDAHLHPEWQQKLVPIVREEFKNLQVVATTHSPLIVGGMKQPELLIADRDPNERTTVTVTRSIVDPEGLRADQVLTTPLFGLQSTRSPEVVKKIHRYAYLFGKSELTAEEHAEMATLKGALSGMLMHGETPADREAERAATQATKDTSAAIIATAAASSPEAKELLRQELTNSETDA